jgi:hypothetical protein
MLFSRHLPLVRSPSQRSLRRTLPKAKTWTRHSKTTGTSSCATSGCGTSHVTNPSLSAPTVVHLHSPHHDAGSQAGTCQWTPVLRATQHASHRKATNFCPIHHLEHPKMLMASFLCHVVPGILPQQQQIDWHGSVDPGVLSVSGFALSVRLVFAKRHHSTRSLAVERLSGTLVG